MAFDLAEEHVLKAEAALGARLPEAYRDHGPHGQDGPEQNPAHP